MESQTSPKSVAIIGAGPSGLATAKECLANGLIPKIFEQASNIGGLWNPEAGGTWPGMKTNLSKFTCTFSDFLWPESASEFPTQREVYEYLGSYCDHFSLKDIIHLNATVIKAKEIENKWQITYKYDGKEFSEEFDFLVVASGIFSLEFYPEIPGKEVYQGQISHSLKYKGPSRIEGTNITVIGGSFSGSEIAVDLCKGGKAVTNVIQNPMWIMPRYIPDPSLNNQEPVPMDLVFYKRAKRLQHLAVPGELALQKKHEYFKGLSDQGEINPDLKVNDWTKPPKIAISDDYLKFIQEEKIVLKKGVLQSFDKTGMNFADGTHLTTDHILFCTGYLLKLPFFDQKILDKLCFDHTEQFQPLLLYKCTFHPDIKNLSFVGVYKGPYFGIMELQARWTAEVFSGNSQLPDREVMLNGIQAEKNIKQLNTRPQFPHADYIGFADSIAEEIDAVPDLKALETEDPDLYEKLTKYPFIPAHYRLRGHGKNKEIALKQINQVIEFVNRK